MNSKEYVHTAHIISRNMRNIEILSIAKQSLHAIKLAFLLNYKKSKSIILQLQSQGPHKWVLCLWVWRSRKVDKEKKRKTHTHTHIFAHLKCSTHIPSACYSTSNLENHVLDLGLTQNPNSLLNMETKLFNLEERSVKVVINSRFGRLLCEGRTSMSPTIASFCGSWGSTMFMRDLCCSMRMVEKNKANSTRSSKIWPEMQPHNHSDVILPLPWCNVRPQAKK